MPELPDVEIARRDLRRWLVGATVTAARCSDGYVARPAPASRFAKMLVGGTVKGVARRGKWLRIELTDGGRVFSHLGMTGDWGRVAVDAPAERFERARIDVLRRGVAGSVRYVDARRLGRLVAAREDIDDWNALGPDPRCSTVLTSVTLGGRTTVFCSHCQVRRTSSRRRRAGH
jgi:formamidopyrimidine-DNA glycosylase